jgi:hypothetical protein
LQCVSFLSRGDGHLEQFEVQYAEASTAEILGLNRTYRKVVSIDNSRGIKALEVSLIETDPTSTEIVVVATHTPREAGHYGDPEHTEVIAAADRAPEAPEPSLGSRDRELMTAVVKRAEGVGKPVKPVVILTDDSEAALLGAVWGVGARELLVDSADQGALEAQRERLVARWRDDSGGRPFPLTVRLIARDREARIDIDGGGQIPRAPDDGETALALAESGTD